MQCWYLTPGRHGNQISILPNAPQPFPTLPSGLHFLQLTLSYLELSYCPLHSEAFGLEAQKAPTPQSPRLKARLELPSVSQQERLALLDLFYLPSWSQPFVSKWKTEGRDIYAKKPFHCH